MTRLDHEVLPPLRQPARLAWIAGGSMFVGLAALTAAEWVSQVFPGQPLYRDLADLAAASVVGLPACYVLHRVYGARKITAGILLAAALLICSQIANVLEEFENLGPLSAIPIFNTQHPVNSIFGYMLQWTGTGLFFITFYLCIFEAERDKARLAQRTQELSRYAAEEQQMREALAKSEGRLRAIFDTARDPIFIKDRDLCYTEVNPIMEKLSGIPAAGLIGKTAVELFGPEVGEHIRQVERRVLQGEIVEEEDTRIGNQNGRTFHIIKVPMRDKTGAITGLCAIARDVTERKQDQERLQSSLQEKEVLLRELHHRVKNNLQVITSMLNLQLDATSNATVSQALQDCQTRVRSMALIHERLYRSPHLAHLDVADYVRELTGHLLGLYAEEADKVIMDLHIDEVSLGMDEAIPCGIIINELVTNALKHAFNGRESGRIEVSLGKEPAGGFRLSVHDDGVGLPADFKIDNASSLGLKLVHLLVLQLDGSLEIDSKEAGTAFRIRFGQQADAPVPQPEACE